VYSGFRGEDLFLVGSYVQLNCVQWFQRRRSISRRALCSTKLCTVDSEEKIYFSYVQLNCAVIAFLDDGRQIQILKGTTLGLLWPRLLSFGPVVSEEKICICKKMGLPRTQQDTTAAIYSSWYTLSLQN
jgi:hypothetical protein